MKTWSLHAFVQLVCLPVRSWISVTIWLLLSTSTVHCSTRSNNQSLNPGRKLSTWHCINLMNRIYIWDRQERWTSIAWWSRVWDQCTHHDNTEPGTDQRMGSFRYNNRPIHYVCFPRYTHPYHLLQKRAVLFQDCFENMMMCVKLTQTKTRCISVLATLTRQIFHQLYTAQQQNWRANVLRVWSCRGQTTYSMQEPLLRLDQSGERHLQ